MRLVSLLILLLTFGYSTDGLNHLKGRWMVSASMNYSAIENEDRTGYQTDLTLGPTYFVKDYLGLSLNGNISTRRGRSSMQDNYGLTPSIMFVIPLSFGPASQKIYPHISGGYSYSETYMSRQKYSTSDGVRLQAGIFFFLNKNIAIRPYYSYVELATKYRWRSSFESKYRIHSTGISLAIFI